MNTVFTEHLNMIDKAATYPQMYSKIPPLDIIILTDGVPSKLPLITSLLNACPQSHSPAADDPAAVIANAVKRLKNSKYHPNTMGIQFVQIGDDPSAKPVLVELVKGDNGVGSFFYGFYPSF